MTPKQVAHNRTVWARFLAHVGTAQKRTDRSYMFYVPNVYVVKD
jgi:hypothetical protein